MASQPIVLHLPGESHDMLMSVDQPHSHSAHEHDNDHHDEPQQSYLNTDAGFTPSADPTASHDASAHEHAKHIHGHADVPSQPLLICASPAGQERYVHHSQLTGITHTPPVPPPNA